MSEIRIDILMVIGGHGGFENIVNQTSVYLVHQGFQIRYIQLLPSESKWQSDEVTFCCLDLDKNALDLEQARASYADLLRSNQPAPDLIMAAGWPYLNYVAKGASSDAGKAVPVVAWPHGSLQYYDENHCGGIDLFQFADICFAISNEIAFALYHSYPDKPIYRTYNSFDTTHIRYSETRNSLRLAHVGRLSEKKDVHIILRALTRTKLPWELAIVGNGESESSLKELTQELQLRERVHFLGWQENPFASVTDCRAFIMSSSYEGAPLVAVEALASGMQLISTPVGNVEEVLCNPACGSIVPHGDPDALATAMDRLAETPFTPEIAKACVTLSKNYRPENALYDFMCKLDASIRLVLLPEHYSPDNPHLYIRKP